MTARNMKISEMAAASTIGASDLLPIVQSGINKRASESLAGIRFPPLVVVSDWTTPAGFVTDFIAIYFLGLQYANTQFLINIIDQYGVINCGIAKYRSDQTLIQALWQDANNNNMPYAFTPPVVGTVVYITSLDFSYIPNPG